MKHIYRIFSIINSSIILFAIIAFTLECNSQTSVAPKSVAPKVGTPEVVKISGSAAATSMLEFYRKDLEKSTSIQIEFLSKNSRVGILDLINQKADLAVISSNLESLEKYLPSNIKARDFISYPAITSEIVFITNNDNKVKKLNSNQIKDILSGKVTNWLDFGGDNKEIIIITEYQGGGIRSQVEDEFGPILGLKKQMFSANQIEDIVNIMPNALGITSKLLISENANIAGRDFKLVQQIILVALPENSKLLQKFVDAFRNLNIKL